MAADSCPLPIEFTELFYTYITECIKNLFMSKGNLHMYSISHSPESVIYNVCVQQ